MTLTPMRFCRHTWHHNPLTMTVSSRRRTVELAPPTMPSSLMLMGERLTAVSGRGELYGDDCLRQYEELCALYKKGESGVLAIPGIPAMTASFTSVSLIAQPREKVVEYSFSFLRCEMPTAAIAEDQFLADGQTLWDVAYLSGVAIDTLVSLNPSIRYPDEPLYEERVRLC